MVAIINIYGTTWSHNWVQIQKPMGPERKFTCTQGHKCTCNTHTHKLRDL